MAQGLMSGSGLRVQGSGQVPPAPSPQPPTEAKGLTLVELLVAMAILVTVIASTLLIFRGITRAWRTGELRTERYQQARLLFDLFERELSSSVTNARYPLVGLKAGAAAALH